MSLARLLVLPSTPAYLPSSSHRNSRVHWWRMEIVERWKVEYDDLCPLRYDKAFQTQLEMAACTHGNTVQEVRILFAEFWAYAVWTYQRTADEARLGIRQLAFGSSAAFLRDQPRMQRIPRVRRLPWWHCQSWRLWRSVHLRRHLPGGFGHLQQLWQAYLHHGILCTWMPMAEKNIRPSNCLET